MSTTRQKISVESLKDVSVLFEGDIYELAQLLLKVNDTKMRGTKRIYFPASSFRNANELKVFCDEAL